MERPWQRRLGICWRTRREQALGGGEIGHCVGLREVHRRSAQAALSPQIRPTEFNYPIALYGKWHGNKYRFITRFRSDDARSYEPEFEAPFARLEYVSRDCFDLSYHRYTVNGSACLSACRSPKPST